LVAEPRNETAQEVRLPKDYRLDEPDPGVVVLLRDDGAFVAAFITGDAKKEGILQAAREAAREDRAALIKQRA
jgi:hypothetical protein